MRLRHRSVHVRALPGALVASYCAARGRCVAGSLCSRSGCAGDKAVPKDDGKPVEPVDEKLKDDAKPVDPVDEKRVAKDATKPAETGRAKRAKNAPKAAN